MVSVKKYSMTFALILVMFFCGRTIAETKHDDSVKPDSSGYFEINNAKLYYEIYGEGTPLLYLHGGLSSCKDFEKYIPDLCKEYKVITVDRRGHGRSYDSEEAYNYSTMADEMNLVMDKLGIKSAFVIGWSDGGVVGFHLASKYPSKVIKLIAGGANYLVNGMTDDSIEWIKSRLTPENISKDIPSIEQEYKNINPNPDNFSNFITKTQEMWLRDPYISKDDFVKIKTPVLLVAGDREDIRLEHMIEMKSLLTNSQLCILPNTTHFVFSEKNEIVVGILLEFLKGKIDN